MTAIEDIGDVYKDEPAETTHGCELAGVLSFNPLPTNDAHMRRGISISHKHLYGGFNTRRYTSVHGFCFF